MQKAILYILGILIVIGGGCYIWKNGNKPAENTQEGNTTQETSYKDATYMIEGKESKLTDPGVKYFGNEAVGDLNGDGKEDIVFLLTYDGGGSGTFYYVTAALKTDNGYRGTSAVFIGDRIAPQSTEIKDGKVIVNYGDRKPNEPMTASPSVGVSKYLKITENELVQITQ